MAEIIGANLGGVLRPNIKELHFVHPDNTWKRGKVAYHLTYFTDAHGQPQFQWRNAGYLVPPPDPVLGAGYTYPGGKGATWIDVDWTPYPPGDWRYDLRVKLSWFANGSFVAEDENSQVGAFQRQFANGDDVYMQIHYWNDKGNGPITRFPASGTIPVSDTGGGGGLPAPTGAPSNLAVGAVSASTIALSWTAGDVDSPTRIYFRKGTEAYGWLEVAGGATSYTVTGLYPSSNYDLYAAHYSGGVQSATSNIVSATTDAPFNPPSNLTAANASACDGTTPVYQINLTWTRGATGAYTRVEREKVAGTGLPTGSWVFVTNTSGSSHGDNMGVEPGYTYYYRVHHYSGVEETAWSNTTSGSVGTLDCSGGGGTVHPHHRY